MSMLLGPDGGHDRGDNNRPSFIGEQLANLLHPEPLPERVPGAALPLEREDLVDAEPAGLVTAAGLAAVVAPVPVMVTDAAVFEPMPRLVEPAPMTDPALLNPPPVPVAEAVERKKDKTIWGGIALVGLAAAILSWAGWVDLAHVAGIRSSVPTGWDKLQLDLAWLLPLCVDAYALVAARAWLSLPWLSEETRAFAKRSTYVAVGVSVAGNAAGHVLSAIPKLDVWAKVTVQVIAPAIAPVMLALAAHLAALVARDWLAMQSPAPWRWSGPEQDDDGPTVAEFRSEIAVQEEPPVQTGAVEKPVQEPVRTEPVQTEKPKPVEPPVQTRPVVEPVLAEKPVERTEKDGDVDLDPVLVSTAARISAEITGRGERVTRSSLLTALRAAGHKCATEQYPALVKALASPNNEQ